MHNSWVDIKGFEGKYQINKNGEVRSLDMKVWGGKGYYIKKGRIKKQHQNKHGYWCVGLSWDNKGKNYLVHRLLAEAFIPNPENKPFIDHINGNKSDNRLENLRWATAKENANNENTKLYGEKQSMYGKKLSLEQRRKISERGKKKIVCLNTGQVFDSLNDARDFYNMKDTTGLSKCCKRVQHSYGKDKETKENLAWAYYNDYIEMSEDEINDRIHMAKTSKSRSLANLDPFNKLKC